MPLLRWRCTRLNSSILSLASSLIGSTSSLDCPSFSSGIAASVSGSPPFCSSSFLRIHCSYLSTMYEFKTKIGKNAKVSKPSQTSMTPGEFPCTMISSHPYAKIDHTAVHVKTLVERMKRTSPTGIAEMHTATMTKRLKAAEPTTVDGPSSPLNISSASSSMTESRISGADEPKAMSERFATVLFQTYTVMNLVELVPPAASLTLTRFFLLVIVSIELMKMSETMLTPRKQYSKATP
mmetsp:Transcript_86107/g.162274  ORF Transcript_86107/g.162274 Transcript_86107/m.162274 type:complete len:237 (-) Transcript_86107:261-971(-)